MKYNINKTNFFLGESSCSCKLKWFSYTHYTNIVWQLGILYLKDLDEKYERIQKRIINKIKKNEEIEQ